MRNADKPIYPIQDKGFPSHPSVLDEGMCSGLTKREYIAAMAMHGLLANPELLANHKEADLHKLALIAADGLLVELEKPQP